MLPTPQAQRACTWGAVGHYGCWSSNLGGGRSSRRASQRCFVLCTTDYVECVLIRRLSSALGRWPRVYHRDHPARRSCLRAELASGEIDLVLGFDEYMQVPGYLGRRPWLTEPLAGLGAATLELEEERITLSQLIRDAPCGFHSPLGHLGGEPGSLSEEPGPAAPSRSTARLCLFTAAIVSQSDHLLVLPTWWLVACWPTTRGACLCPKTCRTTTTSTASGIPVRPATGNLVER